MSNSHTTVSPLWVAFTGLIALVVAMGIGRFAFTPILPMMQDDANVSVVAGGWLASANYVGYLLGALSAMQPWLRPALAIRGGLLLISVSTLAMGLVDNFSAWLLLRTLAGIASAWVLVFASAWSLEHLAAKQRPQLSGVVFGGVGLGIVIAGVVCIALMHRAASSASAWVIFGVLAFALSIVVWPTFRHGSAAQRTHSTGSASRWDSDSIRLIFCYGASGFGYIIPATFLPLMAKQIIKDPTIFGWSWPIFGLAALVSTLSAAALQRRFSNRQLWSMSHWIMALGVALPVLWPTLAGIVIAALCVGSTFMVIVMVAIREARAVAGVHATHLIAAMTASFAAGQILGPLSVTAFADKTDDFSAALFVASGLLAVSAWALMRPRHGENYETLSK